MGATPPRPCVSVSHIARLASGSYAMELTADSAAPRDLALKIFTLRHSYDLSLPAQGFGETPFVSSPLYTSAARTLFTLPDDDAILAVSIAAQDNSTGAPPCKTYHVFSDALPSGDSRPLSTAARDARKQLALSFADAPKTIPAATLNAQPELRCVHPYRDARIIEHAEPGYPEIARQSHATGRSTIKVNLAADGTVEAAKVFQSSGNAALDDEAVRVASISIYAPEIFRCEPQRGSYLFVVDFGSR
jgi:TonB family protein